jgi:hypothetical protein
VIPPKVDTIIPETPPVVESELKPSYELGAEDELFALQNLSQKPGSRLQRIGGNMVWSAETHGDSAESGDRGQKRPIAPGPVGMPPPGYECKRCGKPGHYIKHCPTNGDPSYDRDRDGRNPQGAETTGTVGKVCHSPVSPLTSPCLSCMVFLQIVNNFSKISLEWTPRACS